MNNPSFNTFCEKYSSNKIGLRRATAQSIRRYRKLYKFPAGTRDLNEKYRLLFLKIDADTGYDLLIGSENEANDDLGVATYKLLVDNWARTEIAGLKGDRNKALLVFYWFRYFAKDKDGAYDQSFANSVKNSLIWTKNKKLEDALTEKDFNKSDSASEIISGIAFENISSQIISVYWVDFMGYEKFYFDVNSKHTHGQATFIGHVWIVRLKSTGRKIVKILTTRKSEQTTISDELIGKKNLLKF